MPEELAPTDASVQPAQADAGASSVLQVHSEGCLHYPPNCPDQLTCPFLGSHTLGEVAAIVEAQREQESATEAQEDRLHPELRLRSETPAQLIAGPDEDFDPVIPGLAYRELKTLVVGLSKAGKSFLLWAKVREVLAAGGRVMYLSEEPRATLRDKMRTFGLLESDGLWVVRRSADGVYDLPWRKVCEERVPHVPEVEILEQPTCAVVGRGLGTSPAADQRSPQALAASI